MPDLSVLRKLYAIDECPDLMTDGCVFDNQCNLMFLSVWGRDTAIQSFIARLTLGRSDQGLDAIHVINERGSSIPAYVNNVDRFEKRLTRAYRRTLFGSLTNLWLFDKRFIRPDKANASAMLLLPKDSPDQTLRLWQLVQETCPLPLLDHWCEPVLDILQQDALLLPLPTALGELQGYQLNLDIATLAQKLGSLIRQGVLTVACKAQSLPLLKAA